MTIAQPIAPLPQPVQTGQILGSDVAPARTSLARVFGFLVMVLLPIGASAWYLWERAADRYASRAAFSIRSNETSAPLEIFGAITQLGTSSTMMDGEILYDFIQSQQMLDAVRQRVDLGAIYARAPEDWLFHLDEDHPIEDLLDHWDLMSDVAIDPANGILTVEIRAFAPGDAQTIAEAVLAASTELVNQLSETARIDAVRYAALELDEAESRLRDIRTRLRAFRDLEQEVDPTQNAQAALGLVATLEEDRARAQVQLESMSAVLDQQAPRIVALQRRIRTLDNRISEERTRLGTGTAPDGSSRPLAAVVGDYEELVVDREFAEQAYTLALATYEQAQAEARRQNRYLAVHIRPTLSEKAEYPDRVVWLITIAALAFAFWSVLSLLLANIRERR